MLLHFHTRAHPNAASTLCRYGVSGAPPSYGALKGWCASTCGSQYRRLLRVVCAGVATLTQHAARALHLLHLSHALMAALRVKTSGTRSFYRITSRSSSACSDCLTFSHALMAALLTMVAVPERIINIAKPSSPIVDPPLVRSQQSAG